MSTVYHGLQAQGNTTDFTPNSCDTNTNNPEFCAILSEFTSMVMTPEGKVALVTSYKKIISTLFETDIITAEKDSTAHAHICDMLRLFFALPPCRVIKCFPTIRKILKDSTA